ncbi:hypothetical protein V5799_029981, partial [Amblyomma americanum]
DSIYSSRNTTHTRVFHSLLLYFKQGPSAKQSSVVRYQKPLFLHQWLHGTASDAGAEVKTLARQDGQVTMLQKDTGTSALPPLGVYGGRQQLARVDDPASILERIKETQKSLERLNSKASTPLYLRKTPTARASWIENRKRKKE